MKNNLIVFVGVFLLTMIGGSIYDKLTNVSSVQSGKAQRLPCHKVKLVLSGDLMMILLKRLNYN